MARTYEPIWQLLKKDKVASISAPMAVHRRIIKAVTKEKDSDLGFKLELSDSFQIARLKHESNGHIIKFTLHITDF